MGLRGSVSSSTWSRSERGMRRRIEQRSRAREEAAGSRQQAAGSRQQDRSRSGDDFTIFINLSNSA
eukprot:751826-Hanusia_phi.AAC.3